MTQSHNQRPLSSVRVQLAVWVFLAILVSWVVSGATSTLLVRQEILALRREMLAQPDLYPNPIPEPRFQVWDLLLGPQAVVQRGRPPRGERMRGEGQRFRPGPPREERPDFAPNPGPPAERGMGRLAIAQSVTGWRAVLLRAIIALAMGALTGMVLGRRFTRPLQELARGAQAYQRGEFSYRVPAQGAQEFAEVAGVMHAMAEQVSAQIAQLEDDAKRRRQLLADVAHELRGPVMTMRTMSGALSEGIAEDPARRKQAVDALTRTSDRLLHLVTDLLDLAKLDLRELPLRRQPVDVREIATESIQALAAAAAQAGVTLHPVPAGAPLMVSADPDRLAQILGNLLQNAISHAGAGAEVRVTLEDGNPLRVRVSDTGRGIPANHLPFIFDAFYRVDTARTPGDNHSGLGLRIVRGLVEAHGGTLDLTSAEGRGTTVTFTLP